ncbi:MAG: SulP family inorganic anion transporter [Candidatus Gastranaerophilales bacterium]
MQRNKIKLLRGNIFGGITAGIIALPLALAFGVASGLGASAGLYGAIITGFIAAIFGGTSTQITGPTGPMTVVIASIAALELETTGMIFATISLAGVFQMFFGGLKFGQVIKFVPYPVVSGFMSGIGAIIVLLQINPLLGLGADDSVIHELIHFAGNIPIINLQSVILGILTLVIVFWTPKKIDSKIPSSLIALVVVSLISIIFSFNVPTIGAIPFILPQIHIPSFSFAQLQTVVTFAITLAILGSIDSLLTSIVADSMTRTKHDSSKELIGQGLGNLVSGLLGGLAGSGATMRTVINIKSGGNSRLSGIVHSVFLLLVFVCLAPVASQIPLSVLAGILIKVGINIIDYKFLKVIKHAPKSDLIVMLCVFLITVFNDLITAVAVGIVLASLLFAHSMSKQVDVSVENVGFDENCLSDEVMRLEIDGVMFFGSASQIFSRIDDLINCKCVILDCQSVKNMDVSAVFALEDMVVTLKDKHIKTIIVFNNEDLANKVLSLGLKEFVESSDIVFKKNHAQHLANNFVSISG